MTVFATPDGTPFFCGTYFPRAELRPAAGVGRHRLAGPAGGRAPAGRRGGRGDRRRPGRRRPHRPAHRRTARRRGRAARQRSTTGRTAASAGRPKFPPHMNLLFLLRHHQRTGVRAEPGDRPAHRRGDGPGRHLRPARRRLRPLLGGRALDRAALREDALRQRPAAAGLHPAVAAHRRPAGPPGGPGHRPVPRRRAAPAGGGLRLRPGRRHRGRRGAHLRLDARPSSSRRSARTTAGGPPTCSTVTEEGTFEHGTSVLRLARDVDDADPEVRARWQSVVGPAARRPGHPPPAGPRRQGGGRLERPGDHRASPSSSRSPPSTRPPTTRTPT